ncbi:FeoA family protein [Vibrio maerlii]|uniref:FeoA family protein n=1 Tax=Vibrio maerlii TaxID=2231648 RepID=UPI000E3E74DA|nr:FeoA family protein [Vibrio maerlii]
MKLSNMNNGQVGQIVSLDALETGARKKLMIMGVLPNTQVRLVRTAPMGDPLQIEVRGVSLAVRKSMAEQIEVECK